MLASVTATRSARTSPFVLGAVLLVALPITRAGAQVASCRTWRASSTQQVPTQSWFEDASATSPTDAWAVGLSIGGVDNVIGHWGGAGWRPVSSNDPSTSLYDVAAVSPTEAWAVGDYGDPQGRFVNARVLQWDGAAWSVSPAPTGGSYAFLYSVSADSATDVWAAGFWTDASGGHPLALHFDGATWTQVTTVSPTGGDVFKAVDAIGPDDVWAVGYQEPQPNSFQPLIEHWDGAAWSVVTAPALSGHSNFLYGLSGATADDVWAVGPVSQTQPTIAMHWDGTTWAVVDLAGQPNRLYTFEDVVAIGADDVWVAGDSTDVNLGDRRPAAEHWDGSAWTITPLRSPGTSGGFYGIGASSSTDIWAVGYYYDSSFVLHPLAEHSHGPCTG